MPYDFSNYHLESGDTVELVEKFNSGLDAMAGVVNNVLPISAVAAEDIDQSVSDFFTKSISSNTTFTFSNPPEGDGSGFTLRLTISSGAVPTWPATVVWPYNQTPSLDSGYVHLLNFLWDGSRYFGAVLHNYPLPA